MTYIIETKHLGIKPFKTKDISQKYIDWLNCSEINRFLEVRFTEWTKESCEKYIESSYGNNRYLFGLYDKTSSEQIGNASVYDISLHHSTFNFGILIGNKNYWGGTIGIQASFMMLYIGFEVLNLRKFSGGCYASQIASQLILKQLGMKLEARIPEQFMFEGKAVDHVIYGITTEHWKEKLPALMEKYQISCKNKPVIL